MAAGLLHGKRQQAAAVQSLRRIYSPENLLIAQSEREILERQLELTRLTASFRKIENNLG